MDQGDGWTEGDSGGVRGSEDRRHQARSRILASYWSRVILASFWSCVILASHWSILIMEPEYWLLIDQY